MRKGCARKKKTTRTKIDRRNMSLRPSDAHPSRAARLHQVLQIGPRLAASQTAPARTAAGAQGDDGLPLPTMPPSTPAPAPPPQPPVPTPPPPTDPAAIAEMQARIKAAKEQQKAERLAQAEAARLLTEQAKAAKAEAKAARDAEREAERRLAEATRQAREREKAEKAAEALRKQLEKQAEKEAKEAAKAQLDAEKAALRQAKEAEKAARQLAAQEQREAREAEKAAREARRAEELAEREARDALRRQQAEALAAARALEQTRKAEKRKAEVDAKAAAAEAKRARIRQEQCDEALHQIHLLRDELETVGDRAEELLAKLISLACDEAGPEEMKWIQRLVEEAMAAQERLLGVIESSGIDWQVEQHEEALDGDEEGEEEEESGEESEEEDDAGVRLGKFGKMEVVPDEEAEEEGDAFDEAEYKKAMEALRKGKMNPGDLDGMDHD